MTENEERRRDPNPSDGYFSNPYFDYNPFFGLTAEEARALAKNVSAFAEIKRQEIVEQSDNTKRQEDEKVRQLEIEQRGRILKPNASPAAVVEATERMNALLAKKPPTVEEWREARDLQAWIVSQMKTYNPSGKKWK